MANLEKLKENTKKETVQIGTKELLKGLTNDVSEKNKYSYEYLTDNHRITSQTKIKESDNVLSLNGIQLFNKQSFSTIIGRAKSRKSYLVSMLAIYTIKASRTGVSDNFTTKLKNAKILYLDNEQSPKFSKKIAKRIERECVLMPDNDNLMILNLRLLPTIERKNAIETLIKGYKPDICILDGTRDVISSINNEMEATELMDLEMMLTSKYNLHLINILHQNKGDDNARGHIGTELMNKSETVLSVEKRGDFSVVKTIASRDITPPDFSIEINEHDIPIYSDFEDIENIPKKKQIENILSKKITSEILVNQLFKSEITKTNSITSIKEYFEKEFDLTIGTSYAKNVIEILLNSKLIKYTSDSRKANLITNI